MTKGADTMEAKRMEKVRRNMKASRAQMVVLTIVAQDIAETYLEKGAGEFKGESANILKDFIENYIN